MQESLFFTGSKGLHASIRRRLNLQTVDSQNHVDIWSFTLDKYLVEGIVFSLAS